MQQLLNVCHSFPIEHSLLYNRTKSYSLSLSLILSNLRDLIFYLGKIIIPKVTQCRCLSVITSDHNCDLDLKKQMRKFYNNASMLIRKSSKCSLDEKCSFN